MLKKIFTIHDSAVGAYLQPFFMTSKGEAIRAFSDTVNDDKTQFNKHPGDFELFQIGEYDDSTGTMTMDQTKQSLGLAKEHIQNKSVRPLNIPEHVQS